MLRRGRKVCEFTHFVDLVDVAAQVQQQPEHLRVALARRPDERPVPRLVHDSDVDAPLVRQGAHHVRPSPAGGHVHEGLSVGVGAAQEVGGRSGDERGNDGGVGVVEGAEEGREAQVLKGRKGGRPVA